MCGLMALTSTKVQADDFKSSFDKIQYRGPDASKIVQLDSGVMGFHRLAIMGVNENGMQPMVRNNNYSICNGEIYNFKHLRSNEVSKYSYISESDCEILLPMYEEYKEEMFSKLDGEYAMVLYIAKEDKWLAARDPLGIRPLFYGYLKVDGKIAFASEAKCLHDLCVDVFPFPIGTYYDDGKFIQFSDITKVNKYEQDSEAVVCKNIHDRLVDAIDKRLQSDVPVGFLLSGGLDSSLVCAVAAKQSKTPIKTFAVGMEKDAIDLAYARIVADFINSDHTEFYMSDEEVLSSLKEVIYHLETYDITTIRASLGMYILCKKIRANSEVRVLLSGEVSDELFGYKYTDYAPNAQAFQEESTKRMKELYEYDVLRADRCISAHGLEARVPFSDYDFANYAMSIDPERKLNKYGIGKYLLRQAFSDEELLESIRMREKAAFSDAVGHSMVDVLKAHAKTVYTSQDLEKGKVKYVHHNPPISEEALLYRDIFESFYPGREYIISAYWMPNKEWPNCDVDDPSARVLPNYHKSGQ